MEAVASVGGHTELYCLTSELEQLTQTSRLPQISLSHTQRSKMPLLCGLAKSERAGGSPLSQSENWEEDGRVPQTHVLPWTGGQVMEAPMGVSGGLSSQGHKEPFGCPPYLPTSALPLHQPREGLTQKSSHFSWRNRTSSQVPRWCWPPGGHTL